VGYLFKAASDGGGGNSKEKEHVLLVCVSEISSTNHRENDRVLHKK